MNHRDQPEVTLVETACAHVRSVGQLLPVDPEHERIVDELMAKQLAGRASRPITRRRA
jgi:hypothetical protein